MMVSKLEKKVILAAIAILATVCAADENTILDKLTGYLWDKEEAGELKNKEGKDEIHSRAD